MKGRVEIFFPIVQITLIFRESGLRRNITHAEIFLGHFLSIVIVQMQLIVGQTYPYDFTKFQIGMDNYKKKNYKGHQSDEDLSPKGNRVTLTLIYFKKIRLLKSEKAVNNAQKG